MLGFSKQKWFKSEELIPAPTVKAQPRPFGRSMMDIVQKNAGPYPTTGIPSDQPNLQKRRRGFPTHPSRPR